MPPEGVAGRPAGRPDDDELRSALLLSQRHGMLGARPIAEVIAHSMAFVDALAAVDAGSRVLDLGSGGGVPGLVIAWVRPDLRVVLVDRRATRVDQVRRLVHRLGLGGQVDVRCVDARRGGGALEGVAAVVARGFGAPSEVLDVARVMLAEDGLLVVSEPPLPQPDRWTVELLSKHGFQRVEHPDSRVAVIRRLRVSRGTSSVSHPS